MYGQATRKDISFSEGMPYNRKTKITHQLVRQSWRESDRLFRGDIANIVNFIMTIDEKGRTLGKVYEWNANRGFGFLSTFNCSRVFFHISDVPEKFREYINIDQIFRFRQKEQGQGVKAIDFDKHYQKYSKFFPKEDLPGYIKTESRQTSVNSDSEQVIEVYYRCLPQGIQTYLVRANNPTYPHLYKLLENEQQLEDAIAKCHARKLPVIKLSF